MKTEIITSTLGRSFHKVAEDAKEISQQEGALLSFDFNGVTCQITEDTDLELLWRDYEYALKLSWPVIGPNCPKEWPARITEAIVKKDAENEARQAELTAKYDAENKAKETAYLSQAAGMTLDLSYPDSWALGLSKNQDDYGAATYRYAERWGILMQHYLNAGESMFEAIKQSEFAADWEGITGFMRGAAKSILIGCWVHGEALKAHYDVTKR